MKPLLEPDYQKQPEGEAAKLELQVGNEEQLETDTVKPLVQPDHREQPAGDAANLEPQADHEEQPKENMVSSWIRRIMKKG